MWLVRLSRTAETVPQGLFGELLFRYGAVALQPLFGRKVFKSLDELLIDVSESLLEVGWRDRVG